MHYTYSIYIYTYSGIYILYTRNVGMCWVSPAPRLRVPLSWFIPLDLRKPYNPQGLEGEVVRQPSCLLSEAVRDPYRF